MANIFEEEIGYENLIKDRLVWFYGDYENPYKYSFSLDRAHSTFRIIPLFGKMGYMMPPISLITDKVPRQPGAVLRERVIGSRVVDIPIRIEATSYKGLVDAQRTLTSRLNVNYGALRFSFAGKTRELRKCSYINGMSGSDNDSEQFIVWSNIILSFEAHDPFFYDLKSEIAYEIELSSINMPVLLDDNFLDDMLGSTIFGDHFQITNPGEYDAWGIWKLYGPMDSDTKVILTTREDQLRNIQPASFSFSRDIEDGEVVTIDTRPTIKTVVSSATGPDFSLLSKTSNMFSIPPGTHQVDVTVTEFNSNTRVEFSADIPYLTM